MNLIPPRRDAVHRVFTTENGRHLPSVFQINNNQFFILNHDNSALIFTMQRNYIFDTWIIPIDGVFF